MPKQYNHGDEKQVKDAKLNEELEQEQVLQDIRAIMDMPEGQRVLKGMFKTGHIEEPFFKGNSNDAFRLGQRDIVLHYWNLCKLADPETFYKIVLENENG